MPAGDALARAFKFLGKRWSAVVLGHLSAGRVSVGLAHCHLVGRGLGGGETPEGLAHPGLRPLYGGDEARLVFQTVG